MSTTRTAVLFALRTAMIAVAVLCLGRAALAEDEPPAPPPPSEDAPETPADGPADAPEAGFPQPEGDAPSGVEPEEATIAEDGGLNPAPDQRKRPAPPPPPGAALPNWDVDHLAGDTLPPALPKPLPFDLRNIRFRHDARSASADGRITPVKRIPQWVDIIERHDLTEWRPKEIGFHAARFPNVEIGDLGNPFLAVPRIRGLGGDRVKILTDGVWPGTQALGNQGGSLSLWDPESTERVEIYHGPGAYLRAIDSPGGFINIVPRRPRQHGPFSYDVRGAVSTDTAQRKYRGRAEIDVGQERVAALAGLTWTSVGDRVTGNGSLDPSSYEQLAADLAMDYFLGPNARLGITLQYMQASDIRSPSSTGTEAASAPEYDRLFLGFTLQSLVPGDVFQGARISFAIDSIVQQDDLTIASEDAGIGNTDNISRYDISFSGPLYLICCHDTWAELNLSYGFLDRKETLLCFGEDGEGETPRDQFLRTLENAGRRPHADLSNCEPVERTFEAEELFISGLITDAIHNGCYDFYSGIRCDYFHVADAQFGDANRDDVLLSAAVGSAVHLTKRTSVYGNLSYGFRRPTLFELGAIEIVNGDPIFPNPDLDAEIHGNAELGLKTSFKNIWSLQAAVFTHYINDTIAPKPLGGIAGGGELDNLGSVWLYGMELTGAWRPLRTFEGLELWGSVGFTETTDSALVAKVPFKYTAAVRYSVPSPKGYVVRRWFSELVVHGASQSNLGNAKGNAYTTADIVFGGQVDLGKGRWTEVNFGISNILNAAYTPPGAVFEAPGLSLFASFSFDV